jgi:hypothetical protein
MGEKHCRRHGQSREVRCRSSVTRSGPHMGGTVSWNDCVVAQRAERCRGCRGILASNKSKRDRRRGTYSSKELRITPARSHSDQGSIRISVCVCPSTASAMDQRDRVWIGRERAELSHAPRSTPTRPWVLSQAEIHQSALSGESQEV